MNNNVYIERSFDRLNENLLEAANRMEKLIIAHVNQEHVFTEDEYLQLIQIQRQVLKTKQMIQDFTKSLL